MAKPAESRKKEKARSSHSHGAHSMSPEERNKVIPKHIMEGISEVERAERKIAQGLGKMGTNVEHKIEHKLERIDPSRKDSLVSRENKHIEVVMQKEHLFARIKRELIEFFRSFREIASLKLLLVSCFDLLFYFMFIGLLLLVSLMVTKAAAPLAGGDPSSLVGGSPDDISKYQSLISKATAYFIAGIALAALSFVVSYIISRALMWTTLLKKRMPARYFGKFTLLNIIWMPFWIIIFLILLLPIDSASRSGSVSFMMWYSIIVIGLYLLVVSYLTYMLYFIFTGSNENRIFRSLKETFVHGAKDAGKLLLPVILIIISFIIINILSLVFNYFLIDALRNMLMLVLLVVFSSWAKIYAVSAMERHVKLTDIWA